MSRREDIDNSIWSDPDFARLTPDAKLVYLWSFTNPHCGMAGLYKVSDDLIMFETKLPADRLAAALDELNAAAFVFYEDLVVWVRTRVKWLRTKTPQIAKSIANDVAKITETHPLRVRFVAEYESALWLEGALSSRVNRGSTEGHGSSTDTGNLANVNRGSVDPLGTGNGVVVVRKGGPGGKPAGPDPDALPDGFPDQLPGIAGNVLLILSRIHAERGGNVPTLRGTGLAIRAFPDRDHVAVVLELERWVLLGNGSTRKVKDWHRQYHAFLERSVAAAPSRTAGGLRTVVSQADLDAARARQMAAHHAELDAEMGRAG